MAKKWIQSAVARMRAKGTVGSFSAAAKRAHMSTSAYARKVLKNPKASTTLKRRAQFALNVAKRSRS